MDASEHPLVNAIVPTVAAADQRQADVFVRGMLIGNGRPVVGSMCMGSALHANCKPWTDAATDEGVTIERLTDQKHNTYPELVASDRARFVVLACEEGGRLRSRQGPRQAEGRTYPPVAAPFGRAGLHAPMVEHPGDGCADRSGGLHLRQGPASLGSAERAAARVSPRMG